MFKRMKALHFIFLFYIIYDSVSAHDGAPKMSKQLIKNPLKISGNRVLNKGLKMNRKNIPKMSPEIGIKLDNGKFMKMSPEPKITKATVISLKNYTVFPVPFIKTDNKPFSIPDSLFFSVGEKLDMPVKTRVKKVLPDYDFKTLRHKRSAEDASVTKNDTDDATTSSTSENSTALNSSIGKSDDVNSSFEKPNGAKNSVIVAPLGLEASNSSSSISAYSSSNSSLSSPSTSSSTSSSNSSAASFNKSKSLNEERSALRSSNASPILRSGLPDIPVLDANDASVTGSNTLLNNRKDNQNDRTEKIKSPLEVGIRSNKSNPVEAQKSGEATKTYANSKAKKTLRNSTGYRTDKMKLKPKLHSSNSGFSHKTKHAAGSRNRSISGRYLKLKFNKSRGRYGKSGKTSKKLRLRQKHLAKGYRGHRGASVRSSGNETSHLQKQQMKRTVPASRRLISANDALIEDYPYVVSIQKDHEHWCAGALLNQRLVITTANCLWKSSQASRLRIRAGSRHADHGGQTAKIQEVMKHPKWSVRRNPDHDVALALLDRNIRFSHSVHAVDLPNRVMTPAFDDAWITSWGTDRRDGIYENSGMTLKVYHSRLMSRDKCNNVTRRYGVYVTENFICMAQTGKRAPCTRDTGAPAVSDGVIWGMASWGLRKLCGTERFPAMFSYTASDSNMDFISNATRFLMSEHRHYPYPDRYPYVVKKTEATTLNSYAHSDEK